MIIIHKTSLGQAIVFNEKLSKEFGVFDRLPIRNRTVGRKLFLPTHWKNTSSV